MRNLCRNAGQPIVPSVIAALAAALLAATAAFAAAPAHQELKGGAILEHPCGKVAVKHMGLVHAGRMDEATKLGSPETQKQWAAMPAADRTMMTGMMKEMSVTEAAFSADIKAHGVLVVDGDKATLTVKQEHKDKNGSSTETLTQSYVIDAKGCWITH